MRELKISKIVEAGHEDLRQPGKGKEFNEPDMERMILSIWLHLEFFENIL